MREFCEVSVREFRGEAERLRRNRVGAELRHSMVRGAREHDAKAERRENFEPVRIVFVKIEDARNTDGAHGGVLFVERRLAEEAVELPVDKGFGRLLACAARLHREFAAVAAKELLPRREAVHLQLAVVAAALAAEAPLQHARGVQHLGADF